MYEHSQKSDSERERDEGEGEEEIGVERQMRRRERAPDSELTGERVVREEKGDSKAEDER